MKNIHILPTDKPSMLTKNNLGRFIKLNGLQHQEVNENQNIYITNDEEIKEGDWVYSETRNKVCKVTGVSKWSHKNDYSIDLDNENYYIHNSYGKKIILTTDQSLDGVQHIDDEFLEWFVKNPSCEFVKIEDYGNLYNFRYLILIPQEEPKQETLEEVAANLFYTVGNEGIASIDSFIKGAKWQQDMAGKKYTEEDLMSAFNAGINNDYGNGPSFDKWLNSLNKQD